MPRKLTPSMSLEMLLDEVIYTRAAIKADPDASDLLAVTDDWLASIETVRLVTAKVIELEADADAARMVSNARLDSSCMRFSDRLALEVGKDRTAARYRQFFRTPAYAFVRTSLSKQTATVNSWLSVEDPLITEMKPELSRWTAAAEAALAKTDETAASRGRAWLAREKLAEDLTRARDGLSELLSARAREKQLPREWAGVFFRTAGRRRRAPCARGGRRGQARRELRRSAGERGRRGRARLRTLGPRPLVPFRRGRFRFLE